MPEDYDFAVDAVKVLAGATFFIILIIALSMNIPPSYMVATMDEPPEPSVFEQIRDFLVTFPYSFCIGGILMILSLMASYYSKGKGAGEVLRTLGPLQGYVFGFGIMLVFSAALGFA